LNENSFVIPEQAGNQTGSDKISAFL